MRFCVLGGAGHIGSRVIRELVKNEPKAEVTVADKNVERAEKLIAELGGKTSFQSVDANDSRSLIEAMKKADVAISTIGPFHKFGEKVIRAAIDAGTNLVDIDDDYDATEECLKLDGKAKNAGITVIIGLGASPGLTNLMSSYGAEKLGGADEIHTSWAWTAVDPEMGPAIIDHYFHAITGKIPTYRDGKRVEVPALSEPEVVDFPQPLGKFEVKNVGHPEPVTIPRYIEGVKTVTNKGTVWPHSLSEGGEIFAKMGLTSLKEIYIKETSIPARDLAVRLTLMLTELAPPEAIEEAMEEIQKYGDCAMYGAGLRAEVRGGDKKLTFGVVCKSGAFATAFPAVIGASMIARGETKERGVLAPEGTIDPKKFLRRITKEIEIMETGEGPLRL